MNITTKEFRWIAPTQRFASGEECHIGKIKVGYLSRSVTRNDPKPWRAHLTLPGIEMKEGTTSFETTDAAKRRIETAVNTWFKWLGEDR